MAAMLCLGVLVSAHPAAADPDLVPFTVPGGCYEPHTAVNPLDPTNVVVAECDRIAVSTNLGRSFTTGFVNTTTLPAGITPGTWTSCADPALAFDANTPQSRLFWTYILCGDYAPADGVRDEITIVVAQINPTTGALIGTPVDVSPGTFFDDKPWIAADADPSSPNASNLYVVWSRLANPSQVMFSRSTDQGATWSAPQAVSAADPGCAPVRPLGVPADACWPSHVAAARNGDVYVGFHTDNCGAATANMFILRDTNGGADLAAGNPVQRTSFQSATTCNVQNNFDNRGPPIANTDFFMQGAMQPWILPDPVRPGNVYVVINDDPDDNFATGDPADVMIARSTDNGSTWALSTISHAPANTVQAFPGAAIDTDGNIVAFWYDTRRGILNANGTPADTSDDYFNLDVFATVSRDGGVTFTSDRRINDAQFDPNQNAPCRFGCGTGEGPTPPATFRIGEYNGIAAANGNAYVAWTGNQSGAQTMFFDVFSLDPIQLTTSPNPSEFGQQVQISATVTGEPGSATPTGTVSFAVDGAAVGGPVTLDATGTAVVAVDNLAVGTHTVSASYSGDAIHPTAEDATTHVVKPLPNIVPGSATVTEGNGGTTVVQVPVSLSAASNLTVTADWTTANQSATAPADFVAASGTVTFTPGQTQQTVAVTIKGDRLDEADESLLLRFSNPQNATIGGFFGLGVVKIVDDDPLPQIRPHVASITEGNSGTKVLQVLVTLSAPSGRTVRASWSTINDQATSPSDFVAASGTVTFNPGQTSKTVAVTIKGDRREEPNERFFVSFTNPTNATIGGIYGLGFATIIDDDDD